MELFFPRCIHGLPQVENGGTGHLGRQGRKLKRQRPSYLYARLTATSAHSSSLSALPASKLMSKSPARPT